MVEQLDKDELLALLHKRCTKCGVVKYLGEFHKHKGGAGGVGTLCKECRRKADRKRRQENKERLGESSRKWYQENKEKMREYQRKYIEENKEKRRETQRKWRQKNKEKKREDDRKRRARKLAASGSHTADQVKARFDYYGNKCIYCGSSDDLQIEHRIPLSRGGSDWSSNLAPACKSCNCSKGTKTEAEFKKLLEKRHEQT